MVLSPDALATPPLANFFDGARTSFAYSHFRWYAARIQPSSIFTGTLEADIEFAKQLVPIQHWPRAEDMLARDLRHLTVSSYSTLLPPPYRPSAHPRCAELLQAAPRHINCSSPPSLTDKRAPFLYPKTPKPRKGKYN